MKKFKVFNLESVVADRYGRDENHSSYNEEMFFWINGEYGEKTRNLSWFPKSNTITFLANDKKISKREVKAVLESVTEYIRIKYNVNVDTYVYDEKFKYVEKHRKPDEVIDVCRSYHAVNRNPKIYAEWRPKGENLLKETTTYFDSKKELKQWCKANEGYFAYCYAPIINYCVNC